MIQARSYTTEWLEAKIKEYEANSYVLAEKMTYAFTLLEQLRFKGLDFIFKGGTSLVLMLDHFHRFSKDIDIQMPTRPDHLTAIFDAIIADTGFIKWELSDRKNDDFQVPKEHYKFFYKQSKPDKYSDQPVLLDIIFVENTYPVTTTTSIAHHFLDTAEPYADVTIPTFDSIAGDKLTTFAPTTIGIPMGKGKAVEIAKQLYDLTLLFEKIEDHQVVGQSFEKTAAMVIHYYKKDYTTVQVYQDIIDTVFVMAMTGRENPALYNEIKTGITSLNQYLNKKTNFGYNIALTGAAKIAWLATCLMTGNACEKLDWKSADQAALKNVKINHSKYHVLNKALKAGYPEAWYYWLHTSQLLNRNRNRAEKEE